MMLFGLVIVLIHVGLALPPAIRGRSWKRFFLALGLSFIGITLPLFIFVMSGFLVPEWKGGCRHGWVDCFHVGKLALLPLVVWASAALYAVDVLRVQDRRRKWMVLGLLVGFVVASVSLVIGVITSGFPNGALYVWYLVPTYVVVWYGIRTFELTGMAGLSRRSYGMLALGSSPFAVATVVIARKYYASLPDARPSCFVVTAAMRGHAYVTGPRFLVVKAGQCRQVNQQLLRLWRLEEMWLRRFPRGHACFRKCYNVIGPVVASRISSPFLADLVFLAIKPLELVAKAIIHYECRSMVVQR